MYFVMEWLSYKLMNFICPSKTQSQEAFCLVILFGGYTGVACGKSTMMFYQYGKTSWVPMMFCHFLHNITNGDHDVFPYPMMFSNFLPLVLWWWNDCKNDIHHHSRVHSQVYRESQGLSQSFSCINSHNNMVNLFLYLKVILIVNKSRLKPDY